MNPAPDLTIIANKFTNRIDKLHSEALCDTSRIDRYCIVSISQLNNFLRAYLLSIRTGAYDSNHSVTSFNKGFQTEDLLIDEIIHIGKIKHWRPNKTGIWTPRDEPAFHHPAIFLKVVNSLGCSNIGTITSAMADSWKIDVLRAVRNYFAHRSLDTEKEAIAAVRCKYKVNERAAKILFEKDTSLTNRVIDDIHDYLIDFAKNIC